MPGGPNVPCGVRFAYGSPLEIHEGKTAARRFRDYSLGGMGSSAGAKCDPMVPAPGAPVSPPGSSVMRPTRHHRWRFGGETAAS